MPTLIPFLRARLAEDEAATKVLAAAHEKDWESFLASVGPEGSPARAYAERMTPTRALAECEARRRTVNLMIHVVESWESMQGLGGKLMWFDVSDRERRHARTVLESLALPYADHPDYDEVWRP